MNNNDFRELRDKSISLMKNDYGKYLLTKITNKQSAFKSAYFYKYNFIINFLIKLFDDTNTGSYHKSNSPVGSFYAFHFKENEFYDEFVWFVFNYQDFENNQWVVYENLEDEKILSLIEEKEFKNDFVTYTGHTILSESSVSEFGFPSLEVDEKKYRFLCEEKCSAINLLKSSYLEDDNPCPDIFQIINLVVTDNNLRDIYSNHIKNILDQIEREFVNLINSANYAPYKAALLKGLEDLLINSKIYQAAIDEYGLNPCIICLNEIEQKRIHAFISGLNDNQLNKIMIFINTYRDENFIEANKDYTASLISFYKMFENIVFFIFEKYWFNSFAITFRNNKNGRDKLFNAIANNNLDKWPLERYCNQIDNDKDDFVACFNRVKEKHDALKPVTEIYLKDVSNGYRHKDIMKKEDVPGFVSYVLLCIRLYIIVFTNEN